MIIIKVNNKLNKLDVYARTSTKIDQIINWFARNR